MLPGRLPLALALGHQQQLARAATLEQLRERLETGMGGGAVNAGAAAVEGPERKMARLAEEQQRLLQQAFQQNLLAMASQVNPASLRMNNTNTRGEYNERFHPKHMDSDLESVSLTFVSCFQRKNRTCLSAFLLMALLALLCLWRSTALFTQVCIIVFVHVWDCPILSKALNLRLLQNTLSTDLESFYSEPDKLDLHQPFKPVGFIKKS